MDPTKNEKTFARILSEGDREQAVSYALDLMKENALDVPELYETVLTPALNHMKCDLEDRKICIWQEHVQTAIVRTVVESCFPFVMEEKKKLASPKKGMAAVICPPEEQHDLGARIVSDFLTICGFDTIFVGSNTPFGDITEAVLMMRPTLVAISVSNFYHLSVTKKIIWELREKLGPDILVVAGGYAFDANPEYVKTVGADVYARTYQDIRKITESLHEKEVAAR